MNYYQVLLFSASVLIAALIGWLRFNRLRPAWLPFLFCITLASANEMLSYILNSRGIHTNLNNNIYVLVESLLIVWQFKNWGLFSNNTRAFLSLFVLMVLLWIIDTFIVSGPFAISFYFRIICSFIIVLMSIHINNELIVTQKGKLLKSSVFLTCTGFIIYFTYKILVETFWLYGANIGRGFLINVYLLLTWINLIVNLIYALALLWIPKKPQHITPF